MSTYNPYENERNQAQDQNNPPQGGQPPHVYNENSWESSRNYGVPVGQPYTPQEPSSAYQPTQTGYQQAQNNSAYRPPEPAQQYSASSGWQAAPPPHASEERLPKKRKGLRIFLGSIACVLAVAIVGMAGYGVYSLTSGVIAPDASTGDQPPASSSTSVPVEGINLQDVPRKDSPAIIGDKLATEQIVEQVSPSVVAVLIYQNGYSGGPVGMGSGIIIREDGYIVTNAHVVESSNGLVVQQSNGESMEARVVGVDTQTDLAVIKVDATDLPAAVFGNSEQVKVGEKVIAIGNPRSMQFYGTVTQGIVSGLNRHLTAYDMSGSSTDYTDLIQTDAAINSGNSGGALVNEYGQVIGINVAKSGGEGVEGLGFAIPSNDAKEVVDDLINVGHVTGRVQLGIRTRGAVNEVEARNANLPYGIWVNSTEEESDISKKGVLPGDIITKIGETDITTMGDVRTALKGKKPGDVVTLEIFRPALPNTGNKPSRFQVDIALMEAVEDEPEQQEQQQQQYEQVPQQSPYGNGGGTVDPFEYFFGQFG